MNAQVPATSLHQITGRRTWYRDNYTDQKAYSLVSSAKAGLLLRHPFWGFLGLDLVLIEMPHSEVPTLCTDGYHIFYSAQFINSLRLGEIEFAIAHEIYHCIFGHTGGENMVQRGRRKTGTNTVDDDFDGKLWNYAVDYVVNHDLVECKIGEFITTVDILFDKKYAGMSSEEVYADLLENPPPMGTETLDIHFEFEITDDPDGNASGNEDGDANGDGDGDANGDGDGEGKGKGKGVTIKIRMTRDELAREKNRWQEIAQRAVAHVENSSEHAGSIPAHLRRLINDIQKPKVDWKAATRKFIVSTRTTGYSFTRPDKRTFGRGMTIPGFRRDDGKLVIAVAIDTSGSVCNDALAKFMSELKGIMKGYRSYELHVFCFEGDVDEATYKLIKSTGRANVEADLTDYIKNHLSGGGGTTFHSVWNFMRNKRIKPRGLILFTDGYPCDTSWHVERGYCPTMFMTVGNRNGWKSPFGTTIAYEDF